jgi:hypothetical protein
MKLIPMIQGCCQLDSPRVATVHAPRGVMLVPTALQRRPLIGMHADRSAAPGPVPSAGQASMSTAAEVKVGSGTDAYTRTQQEQQETGKGGPEGSSTCS